MSKDEKKENSPAITSENKPERNEKGQLLPGNTANPNGRPTGPSITAAIKRKLEEMPEGADKTRLDQLVDVVLKKALEDEDEKTIKQIWNYVDGLPKAQFGIDVDKENLAQLTEFFRLVAGDKDDDKT
ncbi:hypothetical protein CL620_05240 [archaeon]|jgi:hypothetical protein|nr:hypothetical protein [archaeon]|tara:strand:- start:4397 stop:4780 length:384 start_codon:yes stop_codon:yes gene_type:complete